LPDALDLLVVCLDAGCTLTHAVAKVSEELRVAWPDLAHEFSLMRSEIQAGKPRVEAFQNLGERTQVDDIRPIASLLGQAERFGIGIGQALRAHADTARDKRRQRAEEQAAKAGVKIVFPLVLCIFPAFYVVTMGPVMIQFIRVFAGGTLR
jgi:tight adherence protein C